MKGQPEVMVVADHSVSYLSSVLNFIKGAVMMNHHA
jgi:hypothetical protein